MKPLYRALGHEPLTNAAYWLSLDTWSLTDGTLLVFGVEPKLDASDSRLVAEVPELKAFSRKMLRFMYQDFDGLVDEHSDTPQAFIQMAERLGMLLPSGLDVSTRALKDKEPAARPESHRLAKPKKRSATALKEAQVVDAFDKALSRREITLPISLERAADALSKTEPRGGERINAFGLQYSRLMILRSLRSAKKAGKISLLPTSRTQSTKN